MPSLPRGPNAYGGGAKQKVKKGKKKTSAKEPAMNSMNSAACQQAYMLETLPKQYRGMCHRYSKMTVLVG